MYKAGSTPRREPSQRIRSVLLAPPIVVLIGVTLLVEIGIFVGVSVVLSRAGLHKNRELMAFIFGFLMAGFLGVIWYLAVSLSGAGDWLTGARAERWTAKELKSFGEGWFHFSNVPFVAGGPYGVLWLSRNIVQHPSISARRGSKNDFGTQYVKRTRTLGEFELYFTEMLLTSRSAS